MNKTTKTGIALITISLFSAGIYFANAQTTFANEDINNIRAIVSYYYAMTDYEEFNDTYVPYQIDVRYFINVTGANTSTFTTIAQRERWSVKLNINNLNGVNKTIRDAVKDKSLEKWNWTLPNHKILMLAFTKGDNI